MSVSLRDKLPIEFNTGYQILLRVREFITGSDPVQSAIDDMKIGFLKYHPKDRELLTALINGVIEKNDEFFK